MFGRFDPDQELALARERAQELRRAAAANAQTESVADGRRWERARLAGSGGMRVRVGRILVGIGEAIAGQPA